MRKSATFAFVGMAFTATSLAIGPAAAQGVQLLPAPGTSLYGKVVCDYLGRLYLSVDTDECSQGGAPGQYFTDLVVGPAGTEIKLDGVTGMATFNGPVNVNGIAQFTGGQVLSGQTALNGTVSVLNPLNTNGIFNNGSISTTALNVANTLIISGPGTVSMGGNRIQGVAPGTNSNDAVTLGQLNLATSGITTNVTALQTTVAAQGSAITDIQAVNATQSTQIAALEAESLYVAINSDGPAASATGTDAIAIGESALASAADALAIGRLSSATGVNAIAIGRGAVATGSIAVGAGASAGAGGAAFGDLATATGGNSVALGTEASATGLASSALGHQAIASGIASTALGHNSDATALGASAVGVSAQATQNFTTAVGRVANASAVGATALGNNAQATAANSVAIGQNSVANQADTVSVGAVGAERRIVNVAPGTVSSDAVNLGQLNTLGADLGGQIGTLFELRGRDRRDMKQGVAAAMAMAPPPMPSAPGKVAYAVNGATFRGEYALGGSLQYRLNTGAPVAVNVGFSLAGKKNNGVRVGVAGEF